jgi:hypothetical protein
MVEEGSGQDSVPDDIITHLLRDESASSWQATPHPWIQITGFDRDDPTEPMTPASERRRQVERLTESLHESVTLLSELEKELTAGEALDAELRARIRESAALADLTDEQSAALQTVISLTMAEVVDAGNRKTFWQQLAVQIVLGIVFIGLGVAATLIIS